MADSKFSELDNSTPKYEADALKVDTDIADELGAFEVLQINAQPTDTYRTWIKPICAFYTNKREGAVRIAPTSFSEAEALQKALIKSGWKLKFDWYSDSNEAVFRMPTSLHSGPVTKWMFRVYPIIENLLAPLVPCLNQNLTTTGDGDYKLRNNSRFSPDHCFAMRDGIGNHALTYHRVVIESSASQTLKDARQKAKKYLADGDHSIHAVIIIDIKNRPTLINIDRPCTITIEVWVRGRTGNKAKDFPLDMCRMTRHDPLLENQAGGHMEGQEGEGGLTGLPVGVDAAESDTGGDLESVSWGGSTQVGESEGTKVGGSEVKPAAPEPKIRDIFVVYDETKTQNEEANMYLDAYDFLRVCSLAPNERMANNQRTITIPLRELRDTFVLFIQESRTELRLKGDHPPLAILKRKADIDEEVAGERPSIEEFVAPKKRKPGDTEWQ